MKRTLFLILALVACAAPAESGQGKARGETQAGQAAGGAKAVAPAKRAEAVTEKPQVSQLDETGLKSLLEASVKSNRPLLINFWATWCGPCREEFPDLVKIDDEFGHAGGIDFITVSLDDVSEMETSVPEFLQTMRAARIPAYLLNAADPEAAINLVDRTWRGELPATFLFGRKGELSFKHSGRIKPAELRAAIQKTLAAKE